MPFPVHVAVKHARYMEYLVMLIFKSNIKLVPNCFLRYRNKQLTLIQTCGEVVVSYLSQMNVCGDLSV